MAQLDSLATALESLRKSVLRSCETCDHWEGMCNRWNAMPPTEVIERGCDEWEEEIPF
jgi:hypothetical protein